MKFLTLPDGTVLEDAFIVENFLQQYLQLDANKIFEELKSIGSLGETEVIPFSENGEIVKWVTGGHSALKFRGNNLKRRKIWCQKNYKKGMLKYGYTGWQHAISNATCDVQYVRPILKVASALDTFFLEGTEISDKIFKREEHLFNHYIATIYDDETYKIGFHSDKQTNFVEDSYFLVIKLGEARKFEFRLADQKKSKPFFSENLSPGTAIFVRAHSSDGTDANSRVQHGVPEMNQKCKISGSIVARCIKTVVPWKSVQKNIGRAQKTRERRIQRTRGEKEIGSVGEEADLVQNIVRLPEDQAKLTKAR